MASTSSSSASQSTSSSSSTRAMQPQDPNPAALDASAAQAFNYDPSYQQYAQERALHDQAVHNSMAAVSGSAKPAGASKESVVKTNDPSSASASPTSVTKGAPGSTSSTTSASSSTAAKTAGAPARNESLKSNRLCTMPGCTKRGKLPKDQLATAGVAAASLPQHMMDMRQITTPTFAMGVKDLRGDQIDAQRASYVQQQRAEIDMRYKSYEAQTNAGQYLQIHADQRSYEPISLQAGGAQRHYMPVDNGSLPPVSGSMYKPSDRQAYASRAPEQMKNPYSQHWAAKPEIPQHHPDGRVDYFDVNKEQQQQQPPGHHLPYSAQSAQYHHHLSAADSAAAAAAYGQQPPAQRAYYSQQPPQAPASGDQPAPQQQQQPNMMYYSANGYPQHQMHSMQQQQQQQQQMQML
ncbi:hypothetical protein PRIC2_008203 [Phytophthora ramorum]